MAAQELFVDWTFRNEERTRAVGTLGGHQVTLTGTAAGPVSEFKPLGAAYLDENWEQFGLDLFTPQMPDSDMIEIVGLTGHSFTIGFETEVQDLVLHLGSLASTLVFTDPANVTVTKLSGDDDFQAEGNKVEGQYHEPSDGGPSDSNGSVRLRGRQPFSSLTFTLVPNHPVTGHDGVHFQLGGKVEPLQFVDWDSRNEERTEATGKLDGHRVTLTGTAAGPVSELKPLGAAYLDENWEQFGLDLFTPQMPDSDMIEIVGLTGHSFTIKLQKKMEDLVIHLGSLASTLLFTDPADVTVTKLSGDENFQAEGNKVEGLYHQPSDGGPSDSNGSVRLHALEPFNSLTFTLVPRAPVIGHDGVHFQFGGTLKP
ncbi:hypothetical protein GCM10010271_08790 [Streptomyces kurssanovii]|nr:hypothetical protein GCM10010271_08790 [Streptomyces kurssanovii]